MLAPLPVRLRSSADWYSYPSLMPSPSVSYLHGSALSPISSASGSMSPSTSDAGLDGCGTQPEPPMGVAPFFGPIFGDFESLVKARADFFAITRTCRRVASSAPLLLVRI